MANKKILEVENLLQSLSDEMLKLKSATKNYEETNENLQNMCESIDKISITHQKLTNNMTQFLAEMEKVNLEGKKTREFIQSISDEAESFLEAKARRYEEVVEASLSKNHSEISDEFKKQTDKILQQSESQSKALGDEFRKQTDRILQNNENQSKALRLVKYLALLGVLMEVVVIIRMLLF